MESDQACARHPDRRAATICRRCDLPICSDEMVEAPVGHHCSACVTSAPAVRRLDGLRATPTVTRVLLVVIVAVAVLSTTGAIDTRAFGLVPARVGLGEWWRIATSALLHVGLVHLAFNGLLLWRLGQLLEPTLGPGTFLGITASGVAGGGLGVIGLAWLVVATPLGTMPGAARILGAGPLTMTVGASGAVFGLMGAVLVLLRRRGIDPWATEEGSTIGGLVLLNLILTLAIPSISVGGHIGGLIGGSAAASLVGVKRPGGPSDTLRTLGLAALLSVVAAVVARDLVRTLIG